MNTPPLKILCVEDNAGMRLVYQRTCESLGHSIHLASNGIEAQRALLQGPYSIVLSDFMMDGMDGVELLTWMRRNEIETYFILISSYHNATFESLSNIYRNCEFHPKPIQFPVLKEMLRLASLRILQQASTGPASAGQILAAPVLHGTAVDAVQKQRHPFAAEMLTALQRSIAGFDTGVIFNDRTSAVIAWESINPRVTESSVAVVSSELFRRYQEAYAGEAQSSGTTAVLTMMSDDFFQYFIPLEPHIYLHVAVNHGDTNIGLIKLALFKVLNTFVPTKQG